MERLEIKGDAGLSSISCVSSLNGTKMPENKYSMMKTVITAIEAYLETRDEAKIVLINRYLQVLSSSPDLSKFDPHTNIASTFFITIYDFMNILEPPTVTSWYCVDVLINACKNQATRQSLIKSYNFLPCLARLINDQLTVEKKLRLLGLIQDITCGVKIFWQTPRLANLMSTLCKWIEKREADVVTLSLSVLVNLFYKNAMTLSYFQRSVDVKKFIRICLALKGPIVELFVCQISIMLESYSGNIPAEVLPKLIDSTFVAVMHIYEKRDCILIKQVVEFFMNSVKNHPNKPLNNYNKCGEHCNRILEMIENSNDAPKNLECLSILLNLIHFMIEQKVDNISSLYPKILLLALKWNNESVVSYQALAVLKTITVNVTKEERKILETVIAELPQFVLQFNLVKDEAIFNTEYNKRLGALLQLLTAMIQKKFIGPGDIKEFQEEVFTKIFFPILGEDSPRPSEISCSIHAINLYVYALALVSAITDCDKSWTAYMNKLLQHRQIHAILGQAICLCPPVVKKIALELSGSCSFGVSLALTDLENLPLEKHQNIFNGSPQPYEHSFSFTTIKQNEIIDGVVGNIRTFVEKNELGNVPMSELIEFYNYKISNMVQNEQASFASIEQLTKQNTHLHHRVEKLIVENTRLQQMQITLYQKLEDAIKKKEEESVKNRDLQTRVEAEKGKYKSCNSQLEKKIKALSECETSLEETKAKLIEVTKTKVSIEGQLAKLQQLFNKVEENCRRHEKNEQKKDECLKRANETISEYTMQIKSLEKVLAEKQKELDDTSAALQTKSTILEHITKMANSQL